MKTLLEGSANADVERFVYASSCAVYGEAKEILGFEPKVSLNEGLVKLVKEFDS